MIAPRKRARRHPIRAKERYRVADNPRDALPLARHGSPAFRYSPP
ncbi:putative methyltransferase, Methylase of polypeptide chain release factor [Ralstonia solanacearum Po82]|uniref:Putative methyltransferase, Methylase of polypeptide chain release factor n=1 Tax=Ralstonia solanacearum (strain Po82) TaxID=1031711 RepID=F6G6R4_RALS8|nr:putative methyltransferase, Methylase of polypeptide chain release factor [Ralstonia solanacearum Po82]